MNIKHRLTMVAENNGLYTQTMQFPDCELDMEKIKIIMISEVPPENPEDGFYSNTACSNYMETTLGLFEKAGVAVKSIKDILDLGIYITTAVKTPKTSYTVSTEVIRAHLPVLEEELTMFPNLSVIMLMGDVAKKAMNMVAKAKTKKNVIPSESTYKIRGGEYYFNGIRVFPSYIITGGNLLIEKTKCDMISDDIRRMMALI